MYKEFEVNEDLLFLDQILHYLDEYSYCEEINKLLRQLRLKVSKELFSNLPKEDKNKDFSGYKIIYRYFVENSID